MCVCAGVRCEEGGDVEVETGAGEEGDLPTVEDDLGASREGSRTDDEAVERSVNTCENFQHDLHSFQISSTIIRFDGKY